MTDGPFVESEVHQYYQSTHPGELVCLGPDVMTSGPNGVTLQNFRVLAGGLQFPLLRDCADGSALADTNLLRPYFERDNYVVIDRQGVVRYFAGETWLYGNRYHIDELRAAIDPLIANTGVSDGAPRAWGLTPSPNPARGRMLFSLTNPTPNTARAELEVFDPTGRRVAALAPRIAAPGTTTLVWDGRAATGEALRPGVYLVQVRVAGERLLRRVAITR